MTPHTIVLASASPEERETYGLMYSGAQIYAGRTGHLRLDVWDNTNRPHNDHCANHWTHKASPPAYLDPMNKGTDEPVSYVISPQSVMISNPPQKIDIASTGELRDGDSAVLVFPDRDPVNVTIMMDKSNRGYGHAEEI